MQSGKMSPIMHSAGTASLLTSRERERASLRFVSLDFFPLIVGGPDSCTGKLIVEHRD